MEKYVNIIKKSKLFVGLDEDEILSMLKCLNAIKKEYKKNDFIFRVGESITDVGLVLDGDVHIINEDFWGNRAIISHISEGDLFGESYACSTSSIIPTSVVANKDTTVLFLDFKRIITTCPSACVFHTKLISNLITVLAEKNVNLVEKIQHTSKRSTRDKLLSYFSEQSKKYNSSSFEIPFNRQQLADFLCVDRSAMSNELSKMRKEGILDFNKESFKLNSELD